MFSGKFLSAKFLKEIYEETRYKSNPPIFATAKSELSIVAEKVFFGDSYRQFPSETQQLTFKLLRRIPRSQEHLPKVHEWML